VSNWHKRLKAARLKSGLTIAQAATLSKVGKRTFEHWEAGERTPPAEAHAVTRERVIRAISLPNAQISNSGA